MDIKNAEGFLQFISQVKSSRRGGGLQVSDLLTELKSNGSFPGKRNLATSESSTEQAQSLEQESEATQTTESTEEESAATAPPISPELDELATLYVQQYESGAGVELTDEAFEQKKSEVIELYSRLGADRLDNIVFSNDVDKTV